MADIRKRIGRDGDTSYQVRYKDQTGKARYKSFSSIAEARKFEGRIGGEVEAGTHVHDRDSITVSEALQNWLTICKEIGRRGGEPVRPNTLKQYDIHLRHIEQRIGPVKLNRLTGPDAILFRDQLLRDFSRPTAAKILRSLKSALIEARVRGYLASDPFSGISISVDSRAHKKIEIPSKEEVRALLRAADALAQDKNASVSRAWRRYRPMIYLLIFTGVRASEMRGLKPGAIDWDKRVIAIEHMADEWGDEAEPKTLAGERTIGVDPALFEALWLWLAGWKGVYVFGTKTDRPESYANVWNRCWRPLCAKAGLIGDDGSPRYGLHALRHFRASALLAAGWNAKEVAQELGHADAGFTMRTYAKSLPDEEDRRRNLSEKLERSIL